MHRLPHYRSSIYTAFLTIGSLVIFFVNLGSPSDPKKAILFGYSLERIILSAGFFLLTFSLLVLTLNLFRHPERSQRFWLVLFQQKGASERTFWFTLFGFLICWLGLFTPYYRLAGNLSEYVARVYPVLVWLAVVGAVTMLVLIHERKREMLRSILLKNKAALSVGLVVLLFFAAAVILVVVTGLGIRQREDYWYAAGVPVLGLQVLFSLALGMIVQRLDGRLARRFDWLACILLWAGTAYLWAGEPMRSNYFMPETAKNAIYPYSDSALFDMASQFALIGQGLFNGQYFDRSLYSAFLTFLHVLVGQDMESVLTAQAVVYAVFPVLVYLLGRELHSRALGVAAAVLISLRGLNAIIVARWVDTASPKMMLTDFPTAIGIAVFTLFMLKWMKQPSKLPLAVWAGGSLGLTVMLRTHAFLLMPLALLFVFLYLRSRWKYAALGSLLLVLGMLTATLPWDLRNRSNDIPLFYVYYSRIQEVLRARYGIEGGSYDPFPAKNISGFPESRVRSVSRALSSRMAEDAQNDIVCDSRPCSILNHFFRNVSTSVLFLPASFVFDDLWNMTKLATPYWNSDWRGDGFGGSQGLFVFFNLALISLGIGTIWERRRSLLLLPVFLFSAYLLINAFGFTSGGRYIVPVDWIVVIFFMAGSMQAASWFFQAADVLPPSSDVDTDDAVQERPSRSGPVLASLVMIFLIGGLIPLAETPFPRRYEDRSMEAALDMLEQQGRLDEVGISRQELVSFLAYPQAGLLEGRLLYPRYYASGIGEPNSDYPYTPLEYSRLVFTLIGPHTYGLLGEGVIVPGLNPNFPLHASDVMVIGCKNDLFFDALIVIVLDEAGYVYHRFPESALQCPLQSP